MEQAQHPCDECGHDRDEHERQTWWNGEAEGTACTVEGCDCTFLGWDWTGWPLHEDDARSR